MANTYDLLASFTTTSTVASVTVSNIPQTYTHLKIWATYRGDNADEVNVIYVSPNANKTTTNYDGRWLRMIGAGLDAGFGTGNRPGITGYTVSNNNTANLYAAESTIIPLYSNSSNNKLALSLFTQVGLGKPTAYSVLVSTSIKYNTAHTSIFWESVPLFAGSTFYIYGLKSS